MFKHKLTVYRCLKNIYRQGWLKGLLEKGYLAKHTLIIVETERNENINLSDNFEMVDERIYGLAKVRFLKLK